MRIFPKVTLIASKNSEQVKSLVLMYLGNYLFEIKVCALNLVNHLFFKRKSAT